MEKLISFRLLNKNFENYFEGWDFDYWLTHEMFKGCDEGNIGHFFVDFLIQYLEISMDSYSGFDGKEWDIL